ATITMKATMMYRIQSLSPGGSGSGTERSGGPDIPPNESRDGQRHKGNEGDDQRRVAPRLGPVHERISAQGPFPGRQVARRLERIAKGEQRCDEVAADRGRDPDRKDEGRARQPTGDS